jgi:hypothetical protein
MSDFLAAKVFTVVDISIPLPVFGSFCYVYVKWPDFLSTGGIHLVVLQKLVIY